MRGLWLCERGGTWPEGEEEAEEEEEEEVLKPSSSIANAWSNMASFIMDQLLASACKLYHVHGKEVKDWLLSASNVAALH